MNLSPVQLRKYLTAITAVVLVMSVALLGTKPSAVKDQADEKITTVDEGEATPGAEGEVVAEGSPSPGSTARGGSKTAKAAVKAGSGAAPLVAGLGPGITADKIRLGFLIVENNQKMLSFYGVKGGATGDTQQQVTAVVNDLNARGGVLGRKIEIEFRTLDATPGLPDQFPGFCAAFTQDKKVFAVLSPWNSNAAFHACLAKGGVLYITDALTQEDQETFEEFKPYLVSGFMTSSRAAVTLARGLHKVGFFAPGTKLGVIRYNNPTSERVYNNHFKPTLAALGVPPPADVTNSSLTTSAGVMAAQRFCGQGINRVAFITSQGGPPLGFMTAAQSQGCFPIYGIASPDSPAFLAQNAPSTQLEGALAVGWAPGLDVFDAEGPPLTAAEKRCFEVHKKGGVEYTARGGGELAAVVALSFCDLVWIFEEAATKAGPTLNAASFAASLAQFGTSHQSTVTFGTSFSPGIFDGAFQYRTLAYDDSASCHCFKYTGPLQNVR